MKDPGGTFILKMRMINDLRRALEKKGYAEVITPAISIDTGSDPDIEPFQTAYQPLMEKSAGPAEMFLHTSPEFAMKRLIMRGMKAIYQVCPVFRQGEKSPLHSPEFIMAEWYRAGLSHLQLMEEVEEVVVELTGGSVEVSGKSVGLKPPLPRLPVYEAFRKAGAKIDEWRGLPRREFREKYQRAFVDKVEPMLKNEGALFLTDFPVEDAVLAASNPDDPSIARRFELVVAGVEIANGADELTDYQEHVSRFKLDAEVRAEEGKPVREPPREFLAELEQLGLPECSGVALGVDRLAMLAAGVERIDEAFPLPFSLSGEKI